MEENSRIAEKIGLEAPEFAAGDGVEGMLEEMGAAGIYHGVISGRMSDNWGKVPNEEVAELVRRFPERLAGVGAVSLRPTTRVFDEIRKCKDLGLVGVNIDPGQLNPPEICSGAILYPYYAMCQELGLIAYITTNIHSAPNALWSNPMYLDQVAADFPELKIFVAHACYPHVQEICQIAYWRSNIFISPGLYLAHVAFGDEYVRQANTFLQDKIIFSSSYPVTSFKSIVDGYKNAGFTKESYEKVMWKNAAKLFGISIDKSALSYPDK